MLPYLIERGRLEGVLLRALRVSLLGVALGVSLTVRGRVCVALTLGVTLNVPRGVRLVDVALGAAGGHGPLEPQLVDVEGRAVAVHEDHGGGEVEAAGGQDTQRGARVEGVAGQQPRVVEVEAAAGQHQQREQRQAQHPRHRDDGHAALQHTATHVTS